MYQAINWNKVEDMYDQMVWDKLNEQIWLDTRMPVSNDLDDWRKMSKDEQWLIMYVFGGLTLLDTLQSENGMASLKADVQTPHERAVLNNIEYMESIHSKAYSSIFSTLCSSKEIEQIFAWVQDHELLQKKAQMIDDVYRDGGPLEKKVASVMLESFLFYSGFYAPLYYLGQSKLMNVAEVIKLILRDESVHGSYIGTKFQYGYRKLSEQEQESLTDWVYDLLYELYENEVSFTQQLYDDFGLTEDVKVFMRYNGNKALMNLGLEPLFSETVEDVNPMIMNGISTGTANHDFFSAVGNGYLLSQVEEMQDEDYVIAQDNERRTAVQSH